MAQIDDRIATYLKAIEVEGKTPKTIASYANSLQDFRRVGTRWTCPRELQTTRSPTSTSSSPKRGPEAPRPATSIGAIAR